MPKLESLGITRIEALHYYVRDTRRTATFGPYIHDDLALCFRPVMDDLRRSLSMVIDASAIQSPGR